MYSYEDRLQAVQLYLKLGKRIRATIRKLGYPTKNSLIAWHREYERCRDLRAGYVRSKPRYSPEQKKVAVEHYLGQDCCAAATLRALGYPSRETLAAWIEELCPDVRKRIVGRAVGSTPKPQEVKQSAVIALCTREQSARVVAEKTGVSRPTLYNWKNQLLGREVPASMKRKKKPAPDHERAELEQQVESLQRDIRQLQLEHDILKKANELIKKEMGIGPRLLSNREKTALVDALKQTHPLPKLLAALGLARSSYFYHRARQLVADRHAGSRRVIADIFELNHRCYGYRRIRAALGRQQIFISEKVVRRLMRQEGLVAATGMRRRYGSYRGEISPAPENIIDRDFSAAAPNQKWLTDITEFQIPAGKVYLSPMIDCFDGLVVSWSVGTRPDAQLVNTMLDSAIESVAGREVRPVVHSDRGAHYRWPGWISRMKDARLIRSMSRKGCSPDNAACEGFFGRLKTELFYARDWRATTVDQFIDVVDSYIRWYNAKRIKVSLGSLSPFEYRQSRAGAIHPDGRLFGFRALLRYARSTDYVRMRAVPDNIVPGGAAGAFSQLLQRCPALSDWLHQQVRQRKVWLEEVSSDGALRTRLRGLEALHQNFLRQCRELGLSGTNYPLNTGERAIRSLSRHLKDELLRSFGNAARSAGASHLKGLPRREGEARTLAATRPTRLSSLTGTAWIFGSRSSCTIRLASGTNSRWNEDRARAHVDDDQQPDELCSEEPMIPATKAASDTSIEAPPASTPTDPGQASAQPCFTRRALCRPV